MQAVSNEFKQMCKSNTPSGALGRITVLEEDPLNNVEITEENDLQNIDIEDLCYVNDKFIGTTVAKKITVNIFNDDNTYDLENKEIEAKLGFNIDNEDELVSYGNFIIEKPNTEEVQAKTTFTGYDYMIKFNKLYVDNNTYPVELGTYFSNLCTQVGLVAGNTVFTNSTYMVKGNPFTNNEDCRTVLSAIAQIAGGIAKIGRDNKPYIINLSKGNHLETLDGNNYDTFNPNNVFGPINKVIIKMNSGVDGEESVRSDVESISQNGECAITISDNPILNNEEERELVIDNILTVLDGITYLPFKTTYYGYSYADSTDKIKILNVADSEYDSYIFNHKISYDGAISGSIETSALTKTQSTYKNTADLKTKFKRTELAVDKIKGEVTSIIEEQDEINKILVEYKQDINGFNYKVEEAGGVNLIQNSTLENGLDLYHSTTGNVSLEQNMDIKENTTSKTAIKIVNGSVTTQNINIIPLENYTFSCLLYKTELTNVTIKVVSDKIEEYTVEAEPETWQKFSVNINSSVNTVLIEISCDNNYCYIADRMLNKGDTSLGWQRYAGEFKSENVTINEDGITVSNTTDKMKHVITSSEDKIINTLNGKTEVTFNPDETIMNSTRINEKLTKGKIRETIRGDGTVMITVDD